MDININNFPCTIRKTLNGKFLKCSEIYISDVGKIIANTVIASYAGGYMRDNNNMIIVEYL